MSSASLGDALRAVRAGVAEQPIVALDVAHAEAIYDSVCDMIDNNEPVVVFTSDVRAGVKQERQTSCP